MNNKKEGFLYIVATPIGNLSDITIRALETLKEVDVIAAEDTRHTLKLLNHFNICKPLISYHRHNEEIRKDVLIQKLKNGENIALVSDAGTPGISDPGEEIIKACIDENIKIIPIPGACAAVNALVCSGINTKEFLFFGFLPLNKKNRKEKLEEISKTNKTVILYESPYKFKHTIEDLNLILKSRKLVVAREITKIHEEFIRGDISFLIDNIEKIKGEIVIIIEGKLENEEEMKELSEEELYIMYEEEGFNKKEIIKKIAKDKKVEKDKIYKMFLNKN